MATRIPFTASQWEELENQALVFKYLAANVPVPPHLLFLIRRPFLFSSSASSFSSSSSNLFSTHFGWNVYEMGMGRKIDAEPGRCRRTDGKKWRCSKDASLDSKYCERHMHRGKNRSSRKPLPLPSPPPQLSVPSTPTTESEVRKLKIFSICGESLNVSVTAGLFLHHLIGNKLSILIPWCELFYKNFIFASNLGSTMYLILLSFYGYLTKFDRKITLYNV